MVRRKEKKVTIPDGDLKIFSGNTFDTSIGATYSQKTERRGSGLSPPPSKRFSKARTSAMRRSTIGRHRAASSRSSVYTVQKKWRVAQRAVMTMNPHYQGNTLLRYLYLLLQFLLTFFTIWWTKKQISTRTVRKMVVCQIIGLIIMGFLFSTGGVFNISIFSGSTNEYTVDFYWAMTIVSMVVFVLSIMGCIGIFRPNIFITEIYAVVSFIFGHLIFSVVLAWYLLVVLDAYLSVKYFHDDHLSRNASYAHTHRPHIPQPDRRNKGFCTTEKRTTTMNTTVAPKKTDEGRIFNYRSDEQIFKDKLLRQYCLMLLFASIIMMSSGVLTTKLLIQVRRKQGYVYVETAHMYGGAVQLPPPDPSTLQSAKAQ